MSGIKKKTRGKDKKKRKPRKQTAQPISPDEPKRDLIRNIIRSVSDKIKKEKPEPETWSFDFGEKSEDKKPLKGVVARHVIYRKVEINLKEL